MGAWVPFEAIVATSHRVEKYGGVLFADEALQQIVDALNSGKLPMTGHHDSTKPVRTKDLEARLAVLDDGERAVRVTGLVDEYDWNSLGPVRGMSFTTMETIGRATGPHPELEPLALSADPSWFDDEAIATASSIMSQVAPVEGNRLLQFTAIETVRIIIDVGYNTLMLLGPNLASSAIWDGLKYLLLHKKTRKGLDSPASKIEISTDLDAGKIVGVIDTDNPDILEQALAAYSKAVESAAQTRTGSPIVIIWDSDHGDGWSLLGGPDMPEPPTELDPQG